MDIKQEILKLKDGEVYVWPESDYGRAELWLKHGIYFLFEIPTFGGESRFVRAYGLDTLSLLISEVTSWT